MHPEDELNARLVANTHPADWAEPEPAPSYNLVVVGGGTAGLVSAAGAAGLGAKVALVERRYLGGDCLNFGCVPSKAILRSARVAGDVAAAARLGLRAGPVETDFGEVMRRMREVRARISAHDSARRFRDLGVDVFLGEARFTSPGTVSVNGKTLRFRKAVIATGARPGAPPIPGLGETGFLTNETIFSLTDLPASMTVIGAGPVGCELAQAFRRFGSVVTLMDVADRILPNEDEEAARLVHQVLEREGIRLVLGARITRAERRGGMKVIGYEAGGEALEIASLELLVAAGRTANVEGLGLDVAGVRTDRGGVLVDGRLRTTNRRVYAAGDVCMAHKFTHAADFAARIVIQNALFLGRKRLGALTIPWAVYTDPEIAHVGLGPREAAARGLAVTTLVRRFADVDRAVTDGEEEGFVKIHLEKGTDRILGATIVARHAGEMIGELSLAVTKKIGLGAIASVIHPYPTQAEAIRQLGDAYNRTRLTPAVKRLLAWWLARTR